MHIAVIHPCFGIFGGAERAVLSFIGEFLNAGEEVTLVTAYFPETCHKTLSGSGSSFHLREVAPGRLQPPRRREDLVYRYFRYLLNGVRTAMEDASSFDVLHPYNFPSMYSAAAVKVLYKKPAVRFCMDFSELVYPSSTFYTRVGGVRRILWRSMATSLRPIDQAAAKLMDVMVACSRYSSRIIGELYGRRVENVHLGVDIDEFRPGLNCGGLRTKLGYGEGDRIILCPGPFRPPKYTELALMALPSILKEVPEAKLLLVGSGHFIGDYLRLAEKLGISDVVKVTGAVPEEMPLHYNLGDLVVHPSYGEPFGLVSLEAMACGKAVVASRVGGTVEVVEDGFSGLLVENKPEAYAEAVIKLLKDEELSERFGLEGRRIAAKFTWRKVAAKLLGILRSTASLNLRV